jgi:hypothetical protein
MPPENVFAGAGFRPGIDLSAHVGAPSSSYPFFSTTRHRAKNQWKTEAPPEPCPEAVFERVVYLKRLRASL